LNAGVHISARVEYALRALCTLAARGGEPLTAEELAQAQGLPVRFLRAILNELRRVGIVTSQRGNEGGYQLARPATEITIGEVFRRLEGPLAEVRGVRPESASYEAAAEHLQSVWVAVRACLRTVLDEVTLQHVVTGKLPDHVRKMLAEPDAWDPR
jgi:Rrf2 family protein